MSVNKTPLYHHKYVSLYLYQIGAFHKDLNIVYQHQILKHEQKLLMLSVIQCLKFPSHKCFSFSFCILCSHMNDMILQGDDYEK